MLICPLLLGLACISCWGLGLPLSFHSFIIIVIPSSFNLLSISSNQMAKLFIFIIFLSVAFAKWVPAEGN
jgi:hypothetical protein